MRRFPIFRLSRAVSIRDAIHALSPKRANDVSSGNRRSLGKRGKLFLNADWIHIIIDISFQSPLPLWVSYAFHRGLFVLSLHLNCARPSDGSMCALPQVWELFHGSADTFDSGFQDKSWKRPIQPAIGGGSRAHAPRTENSRTRGSDASR
jgi:hypothetical protein